MKYGLLFLLMGLYAHAAVPPVCPPGYTSENVCSCVWVEVPCAIENGDGLRQEDGACRLSTCNTGFHAEANACVSDVKACDVPNGIGSVTWPSTACVVTGCDESYHLEGGACVANQSACDIANGRGVRTWPDTQCVLASCNTGFHAENNACVADVVALPRFPASQLANVTKRGGMRFWDNESGGAQASHAFVGATYTILGYQSFAGDTSTDAKLLSNLRYTMGNDREPQGAGGYISQHELHYAVAAVFAKRTPRVWNQLTATEKQKLDVIMKAILVGNAYSCSSENPQIKQNITPIKSLVADQMWWKNAPNFRNACPSSVMTAFLYFGDTQATTILNTFKKGEFAAQAQSLGLTRIYEGYRLDGAAGALGTRPTAAEVEGAIKNWKWALNKLPATSIPQHMKYMLELAFDNNVAAGLNNGAGFSSGGQMRGRIMKGAANLPNLGRLGMANELDTSDAGGPRSAMSYTIKGTRIVLDMLMLYGALDIYKMDATLKNRVDIGMTDLRYKNEQGYYSYSKGGPPASNNEDWEQPRYNEEWGMDYTLGTWFDVIKRM